MNAKEINIELGLDDRGNFDLRALFIRVNHIMPNTHKYISDSISKIDPKELNCCYIQQLFPECVCWENTYQANISTSAIDEQDLDGDVEDSLVFIDGKFYPKTGDFNILFDNDHFMNIGGGSILLYTSSCRDEAYQYIKDVIAKFHVKDEESRESKIDLVGYDGRNFYTMASSIRSVTMDVDKCFNDDFKKPYEQLTNFLDSKESGLALLHGSFGTGKSTLIRHLVKNKPGKYILITQAIAAHMGEPEFVSFLMENKNSIFVVEDCEQILAARTENTFGGAISNILNMTDGLLSDIFNIKFICTFNSDFNKIDKALLRPGRCYAKYEFKPLCKEKVEILLKENNIDLEPKEMTLAEIFNYSTNVEDKPTKKKIGF